MKTVTEVSAYFVSAVKFYFTHTGPQLAHFVNVCIFADGISLKTILWYKPILMLYRMV